MIISSVTAAKILIPLPGLPVEHVLQEREIEVIRLSVTSRAGLHSPSLSVILSVRNDNGRMLFVIHRFYSAVDRLCLKAVIS